MRLTKDYNCTQHLFKGALSLFVTGMRIGKLQRDLSQPRLTTEQQLNILFDSGKEVLTSLDNGLTYLEQYDNCRTTVGLRRVGHSRKALSI